MQGLPEPSCATTGKNIKSARWPWINRLFLITVFLFFGWFLVTHIDHIRDTLLVTDGRILTAAFGVLIVFVLAEAHINTLLILNISGTVPILSGMKIILLSFFARYTPGKVWVLSLRLGLFPSLGAGVRQVLSATVLENFFVLGTGAALYLFIMSFYSPESAILFLITSLAMFLAMIFFPKPLLAFFDYILVRLNHQPVEIRLARVRAAAYTAYYTLAWSLLGVGVWLLCVSIGFEIPFLLAPLVAAAYVGSMTIGFVAFFAPGGLGVREGLFAVAMQRFMTSGEALLAALSVRVILSLAELAAFCLIQVLDLIRKSEKDIQEEKEGAAVPV